MSGLHVTIAKSISPFAARYLIPMQFSSSLWSFGLVGPLDVSNYAMYFGSAFIGVGLLLLVCEDRRWNFSCDIFSR